MKPKRVRLVLMVLVTLLVVGFFLANLLVDAGSSTTVVDAARARCVKDGFPAEKMLLISYEGTGGMFGFAQTATVEFGADRSFGPDGKNKMEPLWLRVKLSRQMNLLPWEVVSVEHEP
jgi:hypothetical protein